MLIWMITEVDLSNGMPVHSLPIPRSLNLTDQITDTMDYSAGDER